MKKVVTDNRQYHLIETEGGHSYLTCTTPSATATILLQDDKIIRHSKLNINHSEFVALASKSRTHKLRFDTISNKVMTIPKETNTPQ